MDYLTIQVHDLRRVAALLFDYVESVQGGEVRVKHDYFWSVPSDALYDLTAPPKDLTIGQISDCLSNLEGFLEEPEAVMSYGFIWLAEVLRAVGHSARP